MVIYCKELNLNSHFKVIGNKCRCIPHTKNFIFTDSAAANRVIKSTKPTVYSLQSIPIHEVLFDRTIKCKWIPNHYIWTGNEEVDNITKFVFEFNLKVWNKKWFCAADLSIILCHIKVTKSKKTVPFWAVCTKGRKLWPRRGCTGPMC